MKKHFSVLMLFGFTAGLAAAQAPEWVNFTAAGFCNAIGIENNFVWVGTSGGLVRLDRTDGTRVFYNAANSGIEVNEVKDLLIDRNGVKWMSLNGHGLCRFDGSSWQHFETINGENLGAIEHMQIDIHNTLWFWYITDFSKGIARYNGAGLVKVLLSTDIPNANSVEKFAVDSSGHFWFSRWSEPLMKFDGTVFVQYDTLFPSVPIAGTSSVMVDQNNILWTVTANPDPAPNSVYSFDGTAFTEYDSTISLNATHAFKIKPGVHNEKIFISETACVVYDDSTWQEHNVNNGHLDAEHSHNVITDSLGYVWSCNFFTHTGFGLHCYDGATLHDYMVSAHEITTAYYASDVKTDPAGNIWMLTAGNLYKYDGFTITDMSPPNMSNNVNLFIDRAGKIYVSQSGSPDPSPTSWCYDGSWDTLPVRFWQVAEDHSGNIWLAANDGLYVQNGSGLQHIPFTDFSIAQITVDARNRKWVSGSTSTGLSVKMFNDTTWTTILNSSTDGYFVGGGKFGYVYLSSPGGVFKTDGSSWSFIIMPLSSWPMAVAEDDNGVAWFTTQTGIAKYDGISVTLYDVNNSGLGSSHNRGFCMDHYGNLWTASGKSGFVCFNENGISTTEAQSPGRISGYSYMDSNGNGLKDSSEINIPNQVIGLYPDSIFYLTGWGGDYHLYADSGSYQVAMHPPANWSITSDSALFHVAVDTSDLCCYDFGCNAVSASESFNIEIGNGIPRCNSICNYWINVTNNGSVVSDADFILLLDSLVDFISSTPPPTQIMGDSLLYHLSAVVPFETRLIVVQVQMPGQAAAGTALQTRASVSLSPSGVKTDSTAWEEVVVCSMDPNDKAVNPIGITGQHLTLLGTSLDYLIRFQNTGTDTAFRVVIMDTLDTWLDMESFEFVSSSHPCVTTYSMSGHVEFRFDNIQLPHKSIDEPRSNGFVKFRIRARAATPENTAVTNKAYIFFDFNSAVITNSTLNTLVSVLPSVPELESSISCQAYPNPTEGLSKIKLTSKSAMDITVRLLDVAGKTLLTKNIRVRQGENTFEMDLSSLEKGMYLVMFSNDAIVNTVRICKL